MIGSHVFLPLLHQRQQAALLDLLKKTVRKIEELTSGVVPIFGKGLKLNKYVGKWKKTLLTDIEMMSTSSTVWQDAWTWKIWCIIGSSNWLSLYSDKHEIQIDEDSLLLTIEITSLNNEEKLDNLHLESHNLPCLDFDGFHEPTLNGLQTFVWFPGEIYLLLDVYLNWIIVTG